MSSRTPAISGHAEDDDDTLGSPIRMIRSEKNYDWLIEKYGADVRPWSCQVVLDNKDW